MTRIIKILLSQCLLFCCFQSISQEAIQIYQVDEGQIVAPLMHQGKLYFSLTKLNSNNEFASQDIFYFINDSLYNMKSLNNSKNNAIVGFRNDSVFLLNSYATESRPEQPLAIFEQTKDGYSFVQNVEVEEFQNELNYMGCYVHPTLPIILWAIKTRSSKGGSDLYISFKKENGKYSKPRNLGKVVNSKEDEITPFLDADGKTIYYSKWNKGKNFDVYLVKRLDEDYKEWSKPSLVEHINSNSFDAYYTQYKAEKYWLSERDGKSSIYTLVDKKSLLEDQKSTSTKSLSENTSNATDKALPFDEEQKNASYIWQAEELQILQNIPKTQSLYFEFNSYELTFESKETLLEIFDIMVEYPSLRLRLMGHTDDQGSHKFNKKLGLDRANTAKNYLVEAGIVEKRLIIESKADLEPLNNNSTEALRQLNRRVSFEFINDGK